MTLLHLLAVLMLYELWILISVKSLFSALYCAFYRLKIGAIFTEILLFKVSPFYNNFVYNHKILSYFNMAAGLPGSEMPMSILAFLYDFYGVF